MQCISFLRFLLPLKVRLLHLGKATRRLLEFSTSLNIGLICLSKEASISTIPFTQESRIISSQARIISSQDYTETLKQLGEARILNLFQRKYTHSLLVGVGLMVLQQFVGVNGIAFYASSIFESAGFPGNIGTIAMICVQVPMTALGMMLTDKSGRRALLMVSAAGTCLGCSLIGLSFSSQGLQHFKDISPFMALIGVLVSQAKPEKILSIKISFPPLEISGRFYFLLVHKFLSQVFTGSFSLGMGGIPWVIMSEIFPINMKGSAGSLVTLVNWGGSWIISYAFNFLMNWNSAVTFFMFASVSVMTIIFVAKFVPETKGQTLEEIQASMNPLSSEG